jgi:hypothetical protein
MTLRITMLYHHAECPALHVLEQANSAFQWQDH